ncbi:MAG: S1/P1 nuclease [Rikenellaceae bacterium]
MFHTSSYAWGKKGHDVIAHIAERHLSAKAAQRVDELLDGRSMVYYANWMDNASHTKAYKESATWHYLNIEKRKDLATTPRLKEGDLLTALTQIEAELRAAKSSDNKLSHSELSDRLKMYIHLIGDLHQPMHLGRPEDKGGNLIPVIYFIEATSLHALWDYFIVEGAHDWSYTEWADQLDRIGAEEQTQITSGSYANWLVATHIYTVELYRNTPVESHISYEYIDKYRPLVEQQFLYAGLRLGAMLNEIFD